MLDLKEAASQWSGGQKARAACDWCKSERPSVGPCRGVSGSGASITQQAVAADV